MAKTTGLKHGSLTQLNIDMDRLLVHLLSFNTDVDGLFL